MENKIYQRNLWRTSGKQVEKTYYDNDENTLIKIIINVPLYDIFDK